MRRILALAAAAVLLLVLLWMGSRSLLGERATPGSLARSNGEAAPVLATPEPERDLSEVQPTDERIQVTSVSPVPNEPQPGARTGDLVILCVQPDGEPVPHVGVVVDPGGDQGRNVRRGLADDEGRARVEDLSPGEVSLWSHHGAWDVAEVVAGEEREVRLEFRAGVPVRGVVVDADERPVTGAEVWLAAWRRDWLGTTRVTTTGADGSFEVSRVGLERSLGATASGHGPSELVDLSQVDVSRPPVELRLQLTSAGGDLRGRVLDPAGNPIAGARVAVGEAPERFAMRQDGTQEEQWTARVAVSAADGTYRIEGLAAATHPVHVLAAGHPILVTEAEIVAGETTTLDLAIERGLRVTGVVRNESGAPVEHAIVLALDAPFDDPFPTQGPTERGVPFRRPTERSDANGAFELEWMPAGDVHLYASKGSSFWDDGDVEFLGMAQETLHGKPGDTLRWDPVLVLGGRIHGRVFFADGKPMGSVFVSASDPEDEQKRYTEHADEEGRFSIPGLENRAYTVSVQLWDPPDDAQPVEQEGIWPSEVELKLYASYSENEELPGTVRVRVEDEAERVPGTPLVLMAHDRGAYYTDVEDGVHAAELPPGRYRPLVCAGDLVVGGGDWFDLAPGQDLDLGTLRTTDAGSLVVHVARSPGVKSARLRLHVDSPFARRTRRVELEPDQDSATFEGLCVGDCVVVLQGVGVADVRRVVPILRNVPAELTLETVPAVLQPLAFTADEKRGWGKLDVAVFDERGELYTEKDTRERWAGELPWETSVRLPIGRFRIEAETLSGLRFRGEIAIDSLEEREERGCRLE